MPKEWKSWHDYRPEMWAAIIANDPIEFGKIVDEALDASHVVRKGDMLIESNEHGRSFSGMNQSDMGITLVRAGLKWDNSTWLQDGIAALQVMLTKWNKGGLRVRDHDEEVAWYCGQTSRNQDDKGATLNKHLYATRTLLEAAEEFREAGDIKLANKFQKAGEEGFLKIVHGKDQPMLKDYFVRESSGDIDYKAWVYYGAGGKNMTDEYYLQYKQKNANYHLYDMELIFQIKDMVSDSFNWSQFNDKQLGGKHTALGGMLEIYENKMEAGGLDVNTPSKNGLFTRTIYGDADALDPQVVDWFEIWA